MTTRCDYCGTPLDDEGENMADGIHHSSGICREYVFSALQAYKRQWAELAASVGVLIESGRALDAALQDAGVAHGRTQLQAVNTLIAQRDRALRCARCGVVDGAAGERHLLVCSGCHDDMKREGP